MKRHLVFAVAILTTGVVIAVLAVTLILRRPFLSSPDSNGLTRFLATVQLDRKPKAFIDLTAMYGWNGRFEVLDAAFSTRDWNVAIPMPTCGAAESDSIHPLPALCDSASATTASTVRDPFAKQAELAHILRGERKATDMFLLMSPFLDERGQSFAWSLFEKNIAPLNDARWVSEHLSLFKPDELPAVLDRFKLKRTSFETIARLPKADMRSLVEGVPLLVSGTELFVRDHSKLGFSPLNYTVYDFASVKTSAGEYDLVVAGQDAFCLERVGNVCWTYSSQTAIAQFERYAAWFLIFALAVLGFLLFIYFRSIAEKAAERERQRLSLQVLSHEFRTPVASMLLLVEQLRSRLGELKETDQDAVMRISSEASKLQRIIEMTKSYLQSDSSTEKFNVVTLPSVNTWVEEFAAELDPRISVRLLANDRSIRADVFWLRFALANLVQNAFAHGCEPVRIRLSVHNDQVMIAVEDEGVCEFTSIKDMTKPFQKSSSSEGMGLGLNITETIVRDWGGTLSYNASPTSFTITTVCQ